MKETSVRLNFLVRPVTRDILVDLQGRTRAKSLTEVLRRALVAYDLMTRTHARGAVFTTLEVDGSIRRLEFPECPRPNVTKEDPEHD